MVESNHCSQKLFFEGVNKNFKLLARLIKNKREKAQITIIGMKTEALLEILWNRKNKKGTLCTTSYL